MDTPGPYYCLAPPTAGHGHAWLPSYCRAPPTARPPLLYLQAKGRACLPPLLQDMDTPVCPPFPTLLHRLHRLQVEGGCFLVYTAHR